MVVKTDEPAIAHKSDVGGVVLGVTGPEEAAAAYADLTRRLGPRVVVARTAPDGVELALGLVRDPLLGPLVVVGTGGVLVELLADRVVRLPPLDEGQARSALDALRGGVLLDGVRGGAPADRGSAERAIASVSLMALELGDVIDAVDINPLRCGSGGCLALDALVVPRPDRDR